jgi:hypothetical protein
MVWGISLGVFEYTPDLYPRDALHVNVYRCSTLDNKNPAKPDNLRVFVLR